MKSNIDSTRRKVEQRDEVNRVEIDGDTSGVILRALVDDSVESLSAFESYIESLGVDIDSVKHVGAGFGTEVEIR